MRIAERGCLIAGLGLLGYLIYELGPNSVIANLRLVGWGIIPIILQELGAYAFNSLGWLAAFPRPAPAVPFRELLSARIAGDAINYLTPTASLGGEFVRSRFVRGRAPGASIVASVAVAKLSQTVGQIAFVVVGLTLILGDTPVPPAVRRGLFIGLSVLTVLVAVLVFVQRRGMFAPLLRFVQRLGVRAHEPALLRYLERLDHEIARVYGGRAAPFAFSSLYFFLGWAMGVVEIYLILWFLGMPVSVHLALTIEVLSVSIDGALFFVPMKAGTQEGGKVLIFTLLGLDPAKGLALGIVRRLRELTWAAIGLLVLSRRQAAPRAELEAVTR